MKNHNITPTDIEYVMNEGEYIVSTTNLAGRITSVNEFFTKACGYREEELLGAQHNIIRHPSTPRAVFWLLWGALEDGEEFSGYVKNLRKDGGYYWVFAHIFPIHDAAGTLIGYKSNRRRPKRDALPVIEKLYAEMLAAEQAAGPRDAIQAGASVLSQALARQRQSYDEFIASL